MRKTLLAAATVGLLAPAFAQAQTANVTLYGAMILDAEVIFRVKQDNTSTTPGAPPPGSYENVYRVSSNVSRFGMRGTESLGGGLSAIFQIEYGVNGDSGGGINSSRDTFVGVQGDWGTAKVGYYFSPYYDYAAIFGNIPTYRTLIFATQSAWANNGFSGATAATGSFAQRIANAIRYDSPNLGGFVGSVMVGARDTAGNASDNDGGTLAQQRRHAYVISTGGQYTNGPIAAGAVYETHNNLRDGIATNPNLQDQAVEVMGSYNFGVLKVAVAYEGMQYDVAQGGELKRNYWAVSGTANVGPGQMYVAYYKANNGYGSAKCTTAAGITSCPRIGAITLGPDTSSQQWEITYTYPLSKRTQLYAGYTMIDNQKNAAYNFGINQIAGICTGNSQNASGSNTGCGDAGKPQGLAVGIAHFF